MMNFLRRSIALCFAALLLAAPARAATTVGTAFADVPATHWAHDSVRWASYYGLVGGVGDKTFGLGRAVTRAEYAMMLCRLMDWEMLTPEEGSFTDNQDKSAWYYSAIETAYAHGALLKLGDACSPTGALPREEMAAMTVRAFGYSALAGIVQEDCPFTDVSTNPGYIAMAYRMGLIGGVGYLSYAPRSVSTREQAAAVLLRAYDRLHADITLDILPADSTIQPVAPMTDTSGSVTIISRAPLEGVYAAAVKAGAGGTVVLDTAPYDAATGERVSRETLTALLTDDATRVYRSGRYHSSYLVNGDRIVWFESEADVADKVQLCQLLGVCTIYFS